MTFIIHCIRSLSLFEQAKVPYPIPFLLSKYNRSPLATLLSLNAQPCTCVSYVQYVHKTYLSKPLIFFA